VARVTGPRRAFEGIREKDFAGPGVAAGHGEQGPLTQLDHDFRHRFLDEELGRLMRAMRCRSRWVRDDLETPFSFVWLPRIARESGKGGQEEAKIV